MSEAVEDAVARLRDGGMVAVVDAADTPGAHVGELVLAAQDATTEAITFLATHGGSLLCLGEQTDGEEELPLPARLVAPDALAPERRAHAHGALALLAVAGLRPVALSCAVTDGAGVLAGREDVLALATEHALPVVTLEELAGLPTARIERVCSADLPIGRGGFTAIGYRDRADGREHMALVLGDVAGRGALVRVHTGCLAGDVFHSSGCDCRGRLERALDAIGREGRGAVVYLRGPDDGLRLGHPVAAPEDPAAVGILRDLGVLAARVMTDDAHTRDALRRGGVEVLGPIPAPIPSQSHRPLESVG
jgi:3,4-dihydroxy 2-butanone 4-phosphate synthase/GTP cyclohydrolase II